MLAGLGAVAKEIEVAGAEEAWRLASTLLVMTDAAELPAGRMERKLQRMGSDVSARIAVGRQVTGLE